MSFVHSTSVLGFRDLVWFVIFNVCPAGVVAGNGGLFGCWRAFARGRLVLGKLRPELVSNGHCVRNVGNRMKGCRCEKEDPECRERS